MVPAARKQEAISIASTEAQSTFPLNVMFSRRTTILYELDFTTELVLFLQEKAGIRPQRLHTSTAPSAGPTSSRSRHTSRGEATKLLTTTVRFPFIVYCSVYCTTDWYDMCLCTFFGKHLRCDLLTYVFPETHRK